MRLLPTAALAALLAGVAAAPAAAAGDPIMPLGQVSKGMRCTAYSVIQGTEISSFDAEVVDVVAGDRATEAPRILLRFSGPAIDRTGVGPGFSGSPIYCPDSEGRQRVIGAISESVGEYGGTLALATPIEQVLGQPVEPPTGTAASRWPRPSASAACWRPWGGCSAARRPGPAASSTPRRRARARRASRRSSCGPARRWPSGCHQAT
jgi:hypothetical protein